MVWVCLLQCKFIKDFNIFNHLSVNIDFGLELNVTSMELALALASNRGYVSLMYVSYNWIMLETATDSVTFFFLQVIHHQLMHGINSAP